METVPINGRPMYLNRQKAGGSYGDDYFWRGGWSHGGQFSQGFGTVDPTYVPAMLWTYQQVIEPAEIAGHWVPRNMYIPQNGWLKQGERSYDSIRQPWHAVLSFVNWPIGVEPVNPGTVLPHAVFDSNKGYTVFRNRWQDGDDIVITSLLGYGPRDGYTPGGGPILAFAYGQKMTLGTLSGKAGTFTPHAAGGVTVADGGAGILGFDASGASGTDALLVAVGAGLRGGANATLHQVNAGGVDVQILAFAKGKIVPAPTVRGCGHHHRRPEDHGRQGRPDVCRHHGAGRARREHGAGPAAQAGRAEVRATMKTMLYTVVLTVATVTAVESPQGANPGFGFVTKNCVACHDAESP